MYKVIIVLVLCLNTLTSSEIVWNENISDIKSTKAIIKEYVDKKYHIKVKKYKSLQKEESERNLEITKVGEYLWQDNKQSISNYMKWKEAKEYCSNLFLGGYGDWRLPTKFQLEKLYENRNQLNYKKESLYWSSTTEDSNSYHVSFVHGLNGKSERSIELYVRCIKRDIQ